MRSHKKLTTTAAALMVSAFIGGNAWAAKYGSPISEADIAAWDIDISTSTGEGLPEGKGTVAEGAKIFAEKCVACHGEKAGGGEMYGSMVGGIGSMTKPKRKLTPGSMYPYAPILFDYVRRTMPMESPQSLTNNEVYALAAYIYNLNGLVPDNATVNADTLRKMKMPNRDGFMTDDRPDVTSTRCMTNCPELEPILKK
ncbi:MAG: cytochrome c [Hyphomicrobiales bacterium]|nr:cytochrome c [Hyphomicrobiales bacterium]